MPKNPKDKSLLYHIILASYLGLNNNTLLFYTAGNHIKSLGKNYGNLNMSKKIYKMCHAKESNRSEFIRRVHLENPILKVFFKLCICAFLCVN